MTESTTPTLTLSPKEEALFEAVRQMFKQLSVHRPDLAQSIVRVAGGWVRDKLLGKESVDIDIAVDFPSVSIVEALARKVQPSVIQNISSIDRNPDSGKDIETVMMTIADEHVEFVNLRTLGPGSPPFPGHLPFPEQCAWMDAHLRDLTINSMFYNINTKQIEDWTNKGFADLKAGIIRTPIRPLDTWRADPIRMLRAIRFAVRFDCSLDPQLTEEMSSTEAIELLHKVSRERVFTELEKILTGPRPVDGLSLIAKPKLHNFILNPINGKKKDAKFGWTDESTERAIKCASYCFSQYDECATSEGHAVDIGVFLLSAFCAPLCLGSSLPFSKAKMKTEWKFPSKYVETMFQLVEAASSLKSLLERFIICHESIEDKTSVVVETGILIKPLADKWRYALTLMQAMMLFCQVPGQAQFLYTTQMEAEYLNTLKNYNIVHTSHQSDCESQPIWKWPSLATSEEIMATLSVKGRGVGLALAKTLEFQILNRGGGEKSEMMKYIKERLQ